MRRVFRIPFGSSPKRVLEREVDEELAFHIETRIQRLVAAGWEPAAARQEALQQFGDVEAVRQDCVSIDAQREQTARRANVLDELRQDVQYTLRSFRRSPGWTAVALLTIALGVGATTTMFRVADTLLLRPIRYPDAPRVYVVRRFYNIGKRESRAPISLASVQAWQTSARSIEAAEPFRSGNARLGTGPDAATIRVAEVGSNFFAFAGAHPLIGRTFAPAETMPNGPGAVLLSEDFWRREYGGSPAVVGTTVELDSIPRTIVGITPGSLALPEFRGGKPEAWIPLLVTPDNFFIPGVAIRLADGASPAAATQELAAIFKRTQVDKPWFRDVKAQLRVTRPQDDLTFRQALVMLIGAVALLLLVACTNVTHLLLARGAARQRELAMRHALGAGRARLLRQLITESFVLAVIGGGLAVLTGWAGLHLLAALRPASLAELSFVSSGRGVLPTAWVLAITAGLAIGLVSALRSAHRDIGLSLRAGGATGLPPGHIRSWLVVGEVALSGTLLVGALLLIHAVFDLQHMPVGFNDRGLYTTGLQFRGKHPDVGARLAPLLRARAARLPGVKGVTVGDLVNVFSLSLLETPERSAGDAAPEPVAIPFIEPDYFAVMGVPILTGHTFDQGSAARNEVIVSQSLAFELWPDGRAIGGRLRNARSRAQTGVDDPWHTVIGVVPDIVSNLLQTFGQRAMYQPFVDAAPFYGIDVIVRLDAKNPGPSLSRFAAAFEPELTNPRIANVREKLDLSIAEPLFAMRVLVAFAVLAVVLAAIGLFGVISYSVSQRTREIGVRMTLGATREAIARLVVGEGIRLALVGIALGLVGSLAATQLVQSMLYGVSRLDPFSFVGGATVLFVVSVAACVAPMLRATGVDPVIAIRAE